MNKKKIFVDGSILGDGVSNFEIFYRMLFYSCIVFFIVVVSSSSMYIIDKVVVETDNSLTLITFFVVTCLLAVCNCVYWFCGVNLFDYKKLFKRYRV